MGAITFKVNIETDNADITTRGASYFALRSPIHNQRIRYSTVKDNPDVTESAEHARLRPMRHLAQYRTGMQLVEGSCEEQVSSQSEDLDACRAEHTKRPLIIVDLNIPLGLARSKSVPLSCPPRSRPLSPRVGKNCRNGFGLCANFSISLPLTTQQPLIKIRQNLIGKDTISMQTYCSLLKSILIS
jgi:hypothetical protein